MIYNPIFELEEEEREQEMLQLKESICDRATTEQARDLFSRMLNFSRLHPFVTLAAAGLLGISFGTKK